MIQMQSRLDVADNTGAKSVMCIKVDQMPFADPADRRIATHRTQRVEVMREQQRPGTHARAGQRGLGAGVATADHDHVETVRKVHEESAKSGNAEGMRILRQFAEK